MPLSNLRLAHRCQFSPLFPSLYLFRKQGNKGNRGNNCLGFLIPYSILLPSCASLFRLRCSIILKKPRGAESAGSSARKTNRRAQDRLSREPESKRMPPYAPMLIPMKRGNLRAREKGRKSGGIGNSRRVISANTSARLSKSFFYESYGKRDRTRAGRESH